MVRYFVRIKTGSKQEKIVIHREAIPDEKIFKNDERTEKDNFGGAKARNDFSGDRLNGAETEGEMTVYLHARAHDGEGNAALIKLLSGYFRTAKSNIIIERGEKSHNKIIAIYN